MWKATKIAHKTYELTHDEMSEYAIVRKTLYGDWVALCYLSIEHRQDQRPSQCYAAASPLTVAKRARTWLLNYREIAAQIALQRDVAYRGA